MKQAPFDRRSALLPPRAGHWQGCGPSYQMLSGLSSWTPSASGLAQPSARKRRIFPTGSWGGLADWPVSGCYSASPVAPVV